MVTWALVRALYLQQTQFPLHREKNGVKRGFLREVGGPAVAGRGSRPSSLPVLQIRRTPEAQGPMLSWVGGPGASERGGVWLSMNALTSAESWQAEGRKRQVQASRAAESWGDSEQLLSWSAWAGSVA